MSLIKDKRRKATTETEFRVSTKLKEHFHVQEKKWKLTRTLLFLIHLLFASTMIRTFFVGFFDNHMGVLTCLLIRFSKVGVRTEKNCEINID